MFEVRNDQGSVVGTHRTYTYGLRTKGTMTLTADPRNSSDYTDPGSSPIRGQLDSNMRYSDPIGASIDELIAFRSITPGSAVGIGLTPSFSPCFVGRRNPNNPAGQIEAVVEYWIFGRQASARSSGIGLEVYNADGSVAMSDVAKPMKIAAVSALDTPGAPGVSSGVAGNYALCYGIPISKYLPGGYTYNSSQGRFFYIESAPLYNPPDAYGFGGGGSFAGTQMRSSYGSDFLNDNQRLTAMLINVQGL